MGRLFEDYELLATSGLFDADYYYRLNPDVAAANVDPLMHYLECGASELRNPSAKFDAQYYVERCRERGEQVDNPLLHYVKVGAAQGLAPRLRDTRSDLQLNLARVVTEPKISGDQRIASSSGLDRKVDYFCDLVEMTTTGRIVIKGWAVDAAKTEFISVLLDGDQVGYAEIGLERPDVGNLYPAISHAGRSGFSFYKHLPALTGEEHVVVLRHMAGGHETEFLFPVIPTSTSELSAKVGKDLVSGSEDLLLNIDLPQTIGEISVLPTRDNLEIVGWALARLGVASLDIAIDGKRVISPKTGIRRIDVQREFPNWEHALTAGFSALLPHRTLPKGRHTVSVELRDHAGHSRRSEFRIEVQDAPDSDGPWMLHRRLTQSQIEFIARPLRGLGQRPAFGIVMPRLNSSLMQQARTTLISLRAQAYENWRLYVPNDGLQSAGIRRALLHGLDDLSKRVVLLGSKSIMARLLANHDPITHFMVLRAGDELGCDALLEFAAYSALHPEADFLYCDERRRSPSSGSVEAFFKPQWSPDLLLSMNYLGRAWCARTDISQLAGLKVRELSHGSSYHLALRLTEQAAAIGHVAATLLQATGPFAETKATERKAIEKALERRKIAATVEAGRAEGSFRVRRQVATRGLVSIIIPTCAAGDLIRTCIDTIRTVTAYRNFEIVCIENIPPDKQSSKDWLRAHADKVIEASGPFNWSRFNNIAAKESRGDFLLFLNDDIEINDPKWIEAMLEHAERPDVGAVGPQLLYPDRRVQQAGMFLAGLGVARHAFRNSAEDDPGYFGQALTERNVIAVTGACLMTRRETFEALGGFDEAHDVVNNDVDYCLRLWRRGLHTIYTPHTRIVHHELASRAGLADSYDAPKFDSKWRGVFLAGDPFFHPRLRKDRDDYAFDWEPLEVTSAGYPALPRESIRRILVVKLDHIGDCITALPSIRRLKGHFPEARISVLTSSSSKAIWKLEPLVEELIEFDFFHARSASGKVDKSAGEWQALRERLASRQFDLAIDLRQHWETREVLQYTSARYLAGFDTNGKFPWLDVAIEFSEDRPLLRKRQHTTDNLINLVDAVAAASEADRATITHLPPSEATRSLGIPSLKRAFRKRVVCVHPCVGNEMRRWPAEYFGQLIDQLIENEDLNVILIGGPDEIELGAKVLETITNRKAVWSVIGSLALENLPALLARCALFVGNNSGPQHVAARLGVATVGIHSGVVDAREWGPKGINAVAIQRAMTCAPCYHSKLDDCNRELACLRGLMPADVVRICQRLLARPVEVLARRSRRRRREI